MKEQNIEYYINNLSDFLMSADLGKNKYCLYNQWIKKEHITIPDGFDIPNILINFINDVQNINKEIFSCLKKI
jgi:hypothetical protein